MRKMIALLVVLSFALTLVAQPAFAQDDDTSVPCMPENAPLGGYDSYAVVTLLTRGEEAPTNSYYYYRLSSVINNGSVCAVSGWIVYENYNQTPDFADAAQFQLLVTENETVLSVSRSYFLELFGFSSYSYNNDGGVTYMLTQSDDAWAIAEIHTAVAQLQVIAPEITLRFEPVTQ